MIDELASVEDQAKSKKGYYLDLVGAEQREMMGDYSIIYQYVEGGKAYWQLVGDERAECGLRVPPEQAASLPYKVEASWPKLAEVGKKSFDAWEKGKENFKQWVEMGYKSDIPVVIWVC